MLGSHAFLKIAFGSSFGVQMFPPAVGFQRNTQVGTSNYVRGFQQQGAPCLDF